MLFGNTSLQADVSLLDFEPAAAAMAEFGGPRFGIEGLRARVGVIGRPLTCSALKPRGSTAAELAQIAAALARGGVDLIRTTMVSRTRPLRPSPSASRRCRRPSPKRIAAAAAAPYMRRVLPVARTSCWRATVSPVRRARAW